MGSRTNNNNNKSWIRNKGTDSKSNDELNYEELREIVQDSSNRFCFDCHQRGPTYVNMTIGSFVCMRCSGLLRGLTPPHRVKSMSMATFTSEEMDFLRERGNDYCKQVWLSLFEGNVLTESSDEQEIRDFMIQKYERKRYYVDPKVSGVQFRSVNNSSSNSSNNNNNNNNSTDDDALFKDWTSKQQPIVNGNSRNQVNNLNNKLSTAVITPSIKLTNNSTTKIVNNSSNNSQTSSSSMNGDFVADFSKADIFVAEVPKRPSNNTTTIKITTNGNVQQPSFANFDNNPIFNAATSNLNQSKPTIQSKLTSQLNSPPPSEDRYAALKDLDNALKSQQISEQSTNGLHSSTNDWCNSPNGGNGLFNNTLIISPQSSSVSSYGSPMLENNFLNYGKDTSSIWNPFSTSSSSNGTNSPYNTNTTWGVSPENLSAAMYNANPFRGTAGSLFTNNNVTPTNGFSNNQQQSMNNGFHNFTPNGFYNSTPRTSQPVMGTTAFTSASHQNGFAETITVNPFKLATNMHANQTAFSTNNPFL